MTIIKQISIVLTAILCIMMGIGLLYIAGLPERADYSGHIIDNLGYVAPEINHTAPPFTLSTLDFEKLSLHDIQSQPIVLNFWATWCVPCRTEMPELQDLYDRYKNDIHILGINLGESPQAVAQWKDEYDLTYTLLLDPLQSVAQLYQIRGQPSTYVLDTNLTIYSLYYGPVSMEQLENDVRSILNSR